MSKPARDIVEAKIAGPLGLDIAAAAYGIHLIANSEMIGAIRAVSTHRGRDVRDFAMVAFGGCGPAHAAQLAREMDIAKVVIPPNPGVFSTFGLLTTELEFQRTKTLYTEANELGEGAILRDILTTLKSEIEKEFSQEVGSAAFTFQFSADMRYSGQSFDLPISASIDLSPAELIKTLVERFEIEHENTYGQRATDEPVMIATIRVTGRVLGAKNRIGTVTQTTETKPEDSRDAWFGPEFGWLESPVVGRDSIPSAGRTGPILVEEYDSVIVVPPGCSARSDPSGSIVITIGNSGS